MTAPAFDKPASDEVADGESRCHHVHVYAVIRVKVAVDAQDHRSAMQAADEMLFANGLGVRLVPAAQAVLDAEYAQEVTGYLVDEAGDAEFARSRAYGPNHEAEGGPS